MPSTPKDASFAICASPFAAPLVLSFTGFAGSLFAPNADILSLLFWQVLLAIEYAPFYLAVSLPIAWVMSRLIRPELFARRSVFVALAISTVVFAVSANLRFSHPEGIGNISPESISFVTGILLNSVAFVWLNSTPINTLSGTPHDNTAQRP